MKVFCSLDGPALEARLIDAIAARPRGGIDDPLLVLVPTRRLADHLRVRITERCQAALGVSLFTYRGFARRVLELALEVAPRILPDAALAELLLALLDDHDGRDADYLRRRPGARALLLSALRDLRDAGIDAGDLPAFELPHAVASIYPRYVAALERIERLEDAKMADEAGLVRAALPHVAGFLERKRIRRAFHHGAYELIGVHHDLLRAVDRAAELTFLLPGDADAPVGVRSMQSIAAMAGGAGGAGRTPRIEMLPPSGDRLELIERLRRMPDAGGSDAGPLARPALELRHVQGPQAELRAAGLRALALHGDGVPLREIAIVARSLSSYAPFLKATFAELGLPFTTSATAPLRRAADVDRFVRLVRVLAGDFARRDVIDLLRAGRPSSAGLENEPFPVHRWDRWSREARLIGGLEEWRSLERFIERRRDDAGPDDPAVVADRGALRTLLAVLDALESDQREWEGARGLDEHVAFLRALARRRFPSPLVDEVLDTLSIAGRVNERGRGDRRSMRDVEQLLERVVDASRSKIGPDDGAGVRVLDLMQARGLTHDAVIWIGFQHGLFPRRGRQDPYLDDGRRAAITAALGRPLYPRHDVVGEERLLMAMTLGAARRAVVVSWQRADDDGRTVARSSAMRDLASVFSGRRDVAAFLEDDAVNPFRPDRVTSHPAERARGLADSLGICSTGDALVAHAVRQRRGAEAARRVIERLSLVVPGWECALDAVESIEEFTRSPRSRRFDAETGVPAPPRSYGSPTALELLARCPTAFFLRQVLDVRELEDEADPHQLESRFLGTAVHETLQELYTPLATTDDLGARVAELRREARERLESIWNRVLAQRAGPSYRRLAGLWRLIGESWLDDLADFVEEDLGQMGMYERVVVEETLGRRLALPDGGSVDLEGRLDRVLHGSKGVRVDDYKTGSARLRPRTQPKGIVTGRHLQLPLYREMAAAALTGVPARPVEANLIGLGPDRKETDRVVPLRSFDLREGMLETVATMVALARAGRFPLRPEGGTCRFCAYRSTCRKDHEPTLRRIEGDPRLADFRDCNAKDGRRPTLETVRAAHREQDDDGSEE